MSEKTSGQTDAAKATSKIAAAAAPPKSGDDQQKKDPFHRPN